MNSALPLEDIILPPAVSWWPMAWGWWLLIGISCVFLALLINIFYKKHQRHKNFQHACQHLNDSTAELTGAALYTQINAWLKIQIRASHPEALNLHSQAWMDFLNNSTNKPYFLGVLGQALSQGIYQAQPVVATHTELNQAAVAWLKSYLKENQKGGRHVGH